jgi:hypothetical protein
VKGADPTSRSRVLATVSFTDGLRQIREGVIYSPRMDPVVAPIRNTSHTGAPARRHLVEVSRESTGAGPWGGSIAGSAITFLDYRLGDGTHTALRG